MRILAAIAAVAVGLVLAGCGSRDDNGSITNSPGVNPKRVQPTNTEIGSQAPTPTVRTTGAGTTG